MPPEEKLGSTCGTGVGLVRDGPAAWLLAPSSVVPLQERRVSESESVSAVTRRDCRDHFGCSVPILF